MRCVWGGATPKAVPRPAATLTWCLSEIQSQVPPRPMHGISHSRWGPAYCFLKTLGWKCRVTLQSDYVQEKGMAQASCKCPWIQVKNELAGHCRTLWEAGPATQPQLRLREIPPFLSEDFLLHKKGSGLPC